VSAPRNTHLTIADDLRRKIQDGVYTRELPTTSELALQHAVSHSVAVRAVNILRDEGTLDAVQGVGLFVAGTVDTRPVTDQIIEMLRSGEFPVGALFPSETELSQRLGVSRNKLRTALARLEGQGLITTRGRGRIVTALPDKERS